MNQKKLKQIETYKSLEIFKYIGSLVTNTNADETDKR
jgi:hypothetical protein